MLGNTSDALILGSLALSLQARITVYSETGELVGSYSKEVNLSVLRHLSPSYTSYNWEPTFTVHGQLFPPLLQTPSPHSLRATPKESN